jgi:hypothetical protein
MFKVLQPLNVPVSTIPSQKANLLEGLQAHMNGLTVTRLVLQDAITSYVPSAVYTTDYQCFTFKKARSCNPTAVNDEAAYLSTGF